MSTNDFSLKLLIRIDGYNTDKANNIKKHIKKDENNIMDLKKIGLIYRDAFLKCQDNNYIYYCRSIKIHKLIIILQMYHYYKTGSLVCEDITYINEERCGFRIKYLDGICHFSDIIVDGNSFSNKPLDIDSNVNLKEKTDEIFNEIFNCYQVEDDDIKESIKSVFIGFSDYDPFKLGKALNFFKDKGLETYLDSEKEFNNDVFKEYFGRDVIEKYKNENNVILKFITE